ncbi:MAG: YtxH domain-containing protein [Anaerolineae bacterium]|nr:YtxH domain-containing protein [Anaerolineae bacterium]
MSFRSFARGFLFGGLIGATGMLLVAPQSGQETRAELRTRGEELIGQAEVKYAEMLKKAEMGVATLQTRVDDVMGKGEQSLSTLQTKVDEMLSKGEQAIAETRQRVIANQDS